MTTKKCAQCDATFTTKSSRAKFCNSKCKHSYTSDSRKEYVKKYNREYRNSDIGIYKHAVSYGNNSKNRRKPIELSFEQYVEVLGNKKCHYCKEDVGTSGLRLDRIDNNENYTIDNCIPCCGKCNNFRGNYLTPKETKKLIEVLKELRGGKVWS